ncbi:hypothetical protein V8C86DRAFT_587017 [Haematococcus lacustris]
MTVASDIETQSIRMQRTGAQQATRDSSSSAALHQTSRTTGINGSASGSQDEAPAACIGPTVSSVNVHCPPVCVISYARVVTSGGSIAAAGGDGGATQAADANVCDTTGRPPSALVPFQRTLPVAGEGSSATGRSPAAAEQLIESLDCDCKGVPGWQNCNGRCGDTYPGSGFVRWISGKRQCVDLEGQLLPQVVSKLHRMVRQIQADYGKQQKIMGSQLQAAEQNATSLARAKHDADSKLKQAETSLAQLQQQNQASQKKLIEQHQKFRCQAQTEAEELRKQCTTAQAHARQLAAEVEVLQKASLRHVDEMETLEERLSTSNAQEEAVAADLRLCKEELASAQSQLAQLNSSSNSAGPGSGNEGAQAQQGPHTAQRCAGGSFPVGFGSVEQRECLDKLSVAAEQLAAVLVQGNHLRHLVVQDMLEAAKGSLDGAASLVSSWNRDSCAAALHHRVLGVALNIAQQQVDWYTDSFVRCLTSCPEAGRTELHAVLQQLQQAKSSTLCWAKWRQAGPCSWCALAWSALLLEGDARCWSGSRQCSWCLTRHGWSSSSV